LFRWLKLVLDGLLTFVESKFLFNSYVPSSARKFTIKAICQVLREFLVFNCFLKLVFKLCDAPGFDNKLKENADHIQRGAGGDIVHNSYVRPNHLRHTSFNHHGQVGHKPILNFVGVSDIEPNENQAQEKFKELDSDQIEGGEFEF
jgi:hypothetical protein